LGGESQDGKPWSMSLKAGKTIERTIKVYRHLRFFASMDKSLRSIYAACFVCSRKQFTRVLRRASHINYAPQKCCYLSAAAKVGCRTRPLYDSSNKENMIMSAKLWAVSGASMQEWGRPPPNRLRESKNLGIPPMHLA